MDIPGNFYFMENDVILLAGDFNSRTTADGEDELSARMHAEPTFPFEECPLKFKQTYKLIPGQEGVYMAERKMGWCDRILFRVTEGANVEQKIYDSLPKVIHSDHTPIYSVFQVRAIQSEDLCETRRLAE